MRRAMVLVFMTAVLAGCGSSGSDATDESTTAPPVSEATTTTAAEVTGACIDSFEEWFGSSPPSEVTDYLPTLVDCDSVAEWAEAAEAFKAPIPLDDPAETLAEVCAAAASPGYLSDGICGEAIRGT